jgi:AsmA protein
MERPVIRLVRDERGLRNWDFESGAAALQLAFAGDVPLGDFVLKDGTIIYENRASAVRERLDSVNVSIDWPSVRQPFGVSGGAIWRGEQVELSGSAETPFDFLNGDATPIEARIDSAPIVMALSGSASDIARLQLEGALTLTTPSLRGFANWLGAKLGGGSTLGPTRLTGTAVFRDKALSVQKAQLSLDGNEATGALKVTAASRPEIGGTLAFDTLDLTPYFADLSAAFARGDWRRARLDTDWFESVAGDVRLSAGSVRIGRLSFGEAAASVSVRDETLEIGIAQAAFIGGALTGDISVKRVPGAHEAQVVAKLRTTDFDLADAAVSLELPESLSGTASLSTDISGSGPDFGALAMGLTGTGRMRLRQGSLPLFGIAEIAAAGNAGAAELTASAPSTEVDSVSAGFSFRMGTAIVEQATVAASTFDADVTGWITLLDGNLGLSGTVTPVVAETGDVTETIAPVPIRFTIDGTLARPVARPLVLAN